MTDIELVDYPAVAPEATQTTIDAFLAACRQVQGAHDDQQRRARITLAIRHADALRVRRDELEQLLLAGDLWLQEHPDPDDEAQWFTAEAEDRAIWDALEAGLHIAFGDRPAPEQARMMGVA